MNMQTDFLELCSLFLLSIPADCLLKAETLTKGVAFCRNHKTSPWSWYSLFFPSLWYLKSSGPSVRIAGASQWSRNWPEKAAFCVCVHTHACTHMQIVVFSSSQHVWEYSELDSSHWETLIQLLVCRSHKQHKVLGCLDSSDAIVSLCLYKSIKETLEILTFQEMG